MLKPLEQWVCDVCGDVIANPDAGYTVWKNEEKPSGYQKTDFRIIHNGDCDLDNADSSMALVEYLGSDGLAGLLSFIDLGTALDPDMESTYPLDGIKNLTEFLDFFRRLQIPYYEEARQYFQAASEDDYFAGASESLPYRRDTLIRLIEKYGSSSEN